MASNIKHITKINAKRLQKIAAKHHNRPLSVCLQKEVWGRPDCTTVVIISAWCSDCGHYLSMKEFIERHGGE